VEKGAYIVSSFNGQSHSGRQKDRHTMANTALA